MAHTRICFRKLSETEITAGMIVLVAIFAAVAIFLVAKIVKSRKEGVTTSPLPAMPAREEEALKPATYVEETIYDYRTPIDTTLFETPFKKTDAYVSNRSLAALESTKSLEGVSARAYDSVIRLFNVNGNEIASRYDEYEKEMQGIFADAIEYSNLSDEPMTTEQFISGWLKAVSDSGYEAEASFETDKSLVFQDGYYYVRGNLKIDVFNLDDPNAVKDWFPVIMEQGKTYTVPCDIGLVYSKDSREPEDMQICAIQALTEAKNAGRD